MQHESTDPRVKLYSCLDELARNPARQLTPIEAQREAPAGFTITIDAWNEVVAVVGPFADHGVRVKTLVQFGGGFLITSLDLLRSYVEVCERGEPKNLFELAAHLRSRLRDLPPFAVPERGPMTRAELEIFIDKNPACQQVAPAFASAVDAAGAAVLDSHLQEFVERATHNADEAIAYYNNLARGRRGDISASTPAKPARKRAAEPVTTAKEA